jgi:hypothetical protein
MTEGTLLYCDPFVFKNGATPKPKYFIVLANTDSGVMLASLPTSKDHVPQDAEVVRGAVSIPERGVNAYVFEAGDQVTDCFAFPRRTFVYGEQVDDYTEEDLEAMGGSIQNLGVLKPELLAELRKCLKQAPNIKRKYIKWL